MSTIEERDLARLDRLGTLLENAQSAPIGDVLLQALPVFESIEDPIHKLVAEEAMRGFRVIAGSQGIMASLFQSPPKLPRAVTDLEYLQLMRIQWAVDELCLAFEAVEAAAKATWGASTPTRFYLNSIYHYTSSLFLVDTTKSTHKDLPMGGTVIRGLDPIGLSHLLEPIKQVLDESFGDTTFGETILNLRHSDLVHGDFSPARVEYLIRQTKMRLPAQQERFAQLMWILFHRLIVLRLQLTSILLSSGKDPGSAILGYIASLEPSS